MMADPDAPRAADSIVVDGSPLEVPRIGAGYRAVDSKVCLTHNGEVCVLPLETAIALRDALSLAIDIPIRAAALAAFDRDSS